jgi:hypothetical protein
MSILIPKEEQISGDTMPRCENPACMNPAIASVLIAPGRSMELCKPCYILFKRGRDWGVYKTKYPQACGKPK